MKKMDEFIDGGGRAEWPRRGDFVFACGGREEVLERCAVESMDGAGTSFLSARRYSPGEEIDVQFNLGLGRNEYAARVLRGRIKACRQVKAAGGARLCRAEASWTSWGSAGAAAV